MLADINLHFPNNQQLAYEYLQEFDRIFILLASPCRKYTNLRFEAKAAAATQRKTDDRGGKLMSQNARNLAAGSQQVALHTQSWPEGRFFYEREVGHLIAADIRSAGNNRKIRA